MELLYKNNKNKPFKDMRDKSEYTRDLICLWLSENNEWKLKVNEELVVGKGFISLRKPLRELI